MTTEATIDIDNDVWLDGEGNLTVDGNRDHTVFSVPASSTVTISGMTITRGRALAVGGGIFNEGDLVVMDSEISDNASGDIAGGIYSLDGALTLSNTLVTRNEATRGAGLLVFGDVEITESTITANVGGGIHSSSRLLVRDSTIADNNGEFAGGGVHNARDASFFDSRITGNEAPLGGGIYSVGRLSLFETTVDGNIADQGGGIYGDDALRDIDGGDVEVFALGLTEIRYSTISNNSARLGAGIYSIALRMTMDNSTVSGNSAIETGGAVYIGGTTLGASTSFLVGTTITDNAAPSASAVFATGETPTLRLAGNILDGSCVAESSAVFLSEGSNFESPGDTCGLGDPSDRVDLTTEDLDLGPLADNGGATQTHLPMAGSVAIDAIAIDDCQTVLPFTPLLDQRLVMRPQGAGCDVGSVEVE
ncbi:MAG: right-handed parallel beta-helix repeat-containing protein [Myxococcota bacterium]